MIHKRWTLKSIGERRQSEWCSDCTEKLPALHTHTHAHCLYSKADEENLVVKNVIRRGHAFLLLLLTPFEKFYADLRTLPCVTLRAWFGSMQDFFNQLSYFNLNQAALLSFVEVAHKKIFF